MAAAPDGNKATIVAALTPGEEPARPSAADDATGSDPTLQSPGGRETPRADRSADALTVAPGGPASAIQSGFGVGREEPGRYRIDRELARGGQGVVYVAWDAHLGREVAFKQLLRLPSAGQQGTLSPAEARFVREARITAQLEHKGIAPLFEVGRRADGSLYATQRLIRGHTLDAALKLCTSLEQRLELIEPLHAICETMAYAHERGVIHRDLKPGNLMIGEKGQVVVLDWGLGRTAQDVKAAPSSSDGNVDSLLEADAGRTQAGAILGTPAYMSPEQAVGGSDADARSDVWSLGVILYELLAGGRPFDGKSTSEVLRKVATEPIKPIAALSPQAPKALAAIAEKALSRDPAQRHQSAAALSSSLGNWLDAQQALREAAASPSLWKWARKRPLLATVAVLAAALAVGGIEWTTRRPAQVVAASAASTSASRTGPVVAEERGSPEPGDELDDADKLLLQKVTEDGRNAAAPWLGAGAEEREQAAMRLVASGIAAVQKGQLQAGAKDFAGCAALHPPSEIAARCLKNLGVTLAKGGQVRATAEVLARYLPACGDDCDQIKALIVRFGGNPDYLRFKHQPVPSPQIATRELKLTVNIETGSSVASAMAYVRSAGELGLEKIPMTLVGTGLRGGGTYRFVIPANLATGQVEYLLTAETALHRKQSQGQEPSGAWFSITFSDWTGAPPAKPAQLELPRQPSPGPSGDRPAPTIAHRTPSVRPFAGEEFALRAEIRAAAGVGTAAVYVRPLGSQVTTTIPLVSRGGDGMYDGTIPAALARGTIEYLFAAKDGASQQTNQGDGSPDKWYSLTFAERNE